MKLITFTFLILFLTTSVFAQSPQAFNYQGVARDLSGNPMPNQNIGLQISILQGSENGTEVYQETHNIITTDLGLFNLQIGTANVVVGNFEDIDWGVDSHFIQLEMDKNGGSDYQLIGIIEMLSVPYALYAENGSKWEDNTEGINNSNGYVGINTSEPSNSLHIKLPPNSSNGISLEGSTSSIANPGIRFLHDNTVVSGIGVNLGGATFYSDDAQIGDMIIRGIDHNLIFSTHSNDNFSADIYINTIGNVGIGNAMPKAKLQVSDGDVYIEDINNGVIMKSPDGQCWRYTPDNTGQLVPTAITCPN